jgi:hypothetical protein
MEEEGIVARNCLLPEPRCPLLRDNRLGSGAAVSGLRAAVSGQRAAVSGQRAAGSAEAVVPNFLSPNSFSTKAEITPTTVLLWKYQRRQKTDVL